MRGLFQGRVCRALRAVSHRQGRPSQVHKSVLPCACPVHSVADRDSIWNKLSVYSFIVLVGTLVVLGVAKDHVSKSGAALLDPGQVPFLQRFIRTGVRPRR